MFSFVSSHPRATFLPILTSQLYNGTILTSSPSGVTVELDYISRAKELIKPGLGTRRPGTKCSSSAASASRDTSMRRRLRVKKNIAYFKMNYAIVFLLVFFLSIVQHPISLIIFVTMMAVWTFLYFFRDEPLVVFGLLIFDHVVLIVISVATFVVLLMHVTTNIQVSVLVGVVLVLVHADLTKTDILLTDEEVFQWKTYPVQKNVDTNDSPDSPWRDFLF